MRRHPPVRLPRLVEVRTMRTLGRDNPRAGEESMKLFILGFYFGGVIVMTLTSRWEKNNPWGESLLHGLLWPAILGVALLLV